MTDSVFSNIIVGVRIDQFFRADEQTSFSYADETKKLMAVAKAIASKTKASLHLVSVLENNAIDITAAAPWLPDFNWRNMRIETIMRAAKKEAVANSRRQLDAIAADVGASFEVETHVVTAKYAAQGILAEAVSNNASMILLGAGDKADRYFTRGFSTPLGVMAESTIPVLVIGQQCEVDFSKDRLKILVADDLREQTAQAMAASLDWATALGGTDVLHVHIEELSTDELRRILGQTVPELRSNADSEKLAADLMKSLEAAFNERLKQRIQGAEERLRESGGTFRFELKRCSFVRDEIERAAEDFGADILVFGRHQKVYRRPFLVGRVTYQAMLSQKRGVLVIP